MNLFDRADVEIVCGISIPMGLNNDLINKSHVVWTNGGYKKLLAYQIHEYDPE